MSVIVPISHTTLHTTESTLRIYLVYCHIFLPRTTATATNKSRIRRLPIIINLFTFVLLLSSIRCLVLVRFSIIVTPIYISNYNISRCYPNYCVCLGKPVYPFGLGGPYSSAHVNGWATSLLGLPQKIRLLWRRTFHIFPGFTSTIIMWF